MQNVKVRNVNENNELAAITTSEDNCIGINLWELFPYRRKCDGFYNWKYQEIGE